MKVDDSVAFALGDLPKARLEVFDPSDLKYPDEMRTPVADGPDHALQITKPPSYAEIMAAKRIKMVRI